MSQQNNTFRTIDALEARWYDVVDVGDTYDRHAEYDVMFWDVRNGACEPFGPVNLSGLFNVLAVDFGGTSNEVNVRVLTLDWLG